MLARSLKRFETLEKGDRLSPIMIKDLIYGWGNPDWSIGEEFMVALVEEALRGQGPILECGSGLSTVLLGVLGNKTGRAVWALEHDPEWQHRVENALRRVKAKYVTVCAAPLADYGEYVWYAPPKHLMPADFSLIACDGPPGGIRGGRYGLVPVMRELMASQCVILLDDAFRLSEKKVLKSWSRELSVSPVIRGEQEPYAIVTVQKSPADYYGTPAQSISVQSAKMLL